MSTQRIYTFHLRPGPKAREEEAWERLRWYTRTYWWYGNVEVDIDDDGVDLRLWVCGKDQWVAHRRARELARHVGRCLDTTPDAGVFRRPAPHTNRGRHRIPVTASTGDDHETTGSA